MDALLIEIIAPATLSLIYGIMVIYFFIGWVSLKKSLPVTTSSLTKSVTVVIPVRNEEKNIVACLESIFKQDYPKHLFEVIVVDDYSTDDTRKIVRELSYPALRLFDLQQYLGARGEKKPNKKEALSIGIKNAQGELILTTDGDTIRNESWISAMVNFYVNNQFKLITAPVLVNPAYTPLQLMQQADVATLMGISAATTHFKAPTMCSGANLMYEKETFTAVEGFKGNNDVPSGDDIFLMQKIHAKHPNGIGFVKSYDAAVFTKPEKGIFSFLAQRIRWVSKSSRYATWWVKSMLVFAYLFNFITLGVGIWCGYQFYLNNDVNLLLPAIILFGSKLFFDLLFTTPVFYFFKKLWLLLLLPLIELLHIIYIVFIGILGLSGRYRWRGRRVQS